MPINRQAYTKKPFPRPAIGGVAYQCNPANYGNATTKVINLYNNTWLSDSVVFAVDSAWRYVVHVRNTHNGASSIHIDDVRGKLGGEGSPLTGANIKAGGRITYLMLHPKLGIHKVK